MTENGQIGINIFPLIHYMKRGKLLLCLCVILYTAIGLAVSFSIKKEYTASVKVIDNDASSTAGTPDIAQYLGVGGAFLAKDDAIFPQIFPDFISSSSFIQSLCDMHVTNKEGKSKTYRRHLLDTYYPEKEIEDPTYDAQMLALGKISCEVDQKTTLITISVTDRDALVAASMADSVFHQLRKKILLYRLEKKEADLAFIEDLYEKSQKLYKDAFENYSKSLDNESENTLQSIQEEINTLENDMNTKMDIYSQVYEQTKLIKNDIQKNYSSLTIVQNATVPIKPDNKSKIYYLAAFFVLGIIQWILIIIFKNRSSIITIQ